MNDDLNTALVDKHHYMQYIVEDLVLVRNAWRL